MKLSPPCLVGLIAGHRNRTAAIFGGGFRRCLSLASIPGLLAIIGFVGTSGDVAAAGFTAGNIVVEQIGDGTTALTSNAFPIKLLEFNNQTANQSSPVQTINLPTSTSGSNQIITASGSAGSEGQMMRSDDGRYLCVVGYHLAPGTTGAKSDLTRTTARVDANGSVDSSTQATLTGTADNAKSCASSDGSGFWTCHGAMGLFYQAYQGGSFVQLSSSITTSGVVGVFNGQVYYTTATGLFSLGSGLPSSGSPSGTAVFTLNSNNASAVGFTFNIAGNICYIADSASSTKGGIYKYTKSGSTWSFAYQLYSSSAGVKGLAADFSGASPVLYGSNAAGSALVKVTDAGSSGAAATTLASAGSNYVFRGVTLAPVLLPVIATSGTLGAVSTTYGAASSATSFTVSGSGMQAGITVTPPAGFEVSQTSSSSGFADSITVGSSGTIASTTVYVRLKATATVVGSPYSGNVVLSSTNATGVNMATASSTVSARALTITDISGVAKTYDGGTSASLSGTAAYGGLANGESFSVTGSPVATFASADAGTAVTVNVTGYTAPSSNYTVTQPALAADINVAPLTITASDGAKSYGSTLTSGSSSTGFSSSGLVGSNVIDQITLTYTSGGSANDAVGSYPNAIVPSNATGAAFLASNYSITYVPGTLTVNALPSITLGGTPSALTFVYGNASAGSPATFTVSGSSLTGNLTITAPENFHVSLSPSASFGTTLMLTASGGTVAATTIYVRMAGTNPVGTYSGDVSVSGGGATTQTVSIPASTVAHKNLAISGLAGVDKQYDRTTMASFSGTAALVGVVGSDDVSLAGAPSATFASAGIGSGVVVTVSGYSLVGTSVGNYTLSQPSGLSANIAARPLTVSGAAVASKTYDGTSAAIITGSLVGVVSGDTVILNGTGTFASAGPGTGIAVTSTSTLGGPDAGNYSLTQPDGLTGDIIAAPPTVTITATDANAAEGPAPDPGTFRIARTGPTTADLAISYTVATGAGQATGGTDYMPALTGSATIPAGQSFVDITITPVDDILLEGDETVTLNLVDTADYDLGAPATATVTIADNETAIDLSRYTRVARYHLPEPTRTTAPSGSLLCQEASSVTYNWDTDTLFVVGDGGTSVVQVSKTGALINSMTLAAGSSPQGTEFYDTEGLSYVGSGKFVLNEERDRQTNLFTYVAGATLHRSDVKTVKLGTTIGNIGLEGVTYDPYSSGFVFVKEKDPESIFQTTLDFNAGTASNGSSTATASTDLFNPALLNTTDFSDIFSLSNLPALSGKPAYSHLLMISQESGLVRHFDRSGNILSTLTLTTDPGDTLSIPDMTCEGVTMDRDGVLYVVNENGGGDANHPQLWVYKPSVATNLAPTVVALTGQVTSLPENTSTAAGVKVADIAITDDGLGVNNLTLSGADAAFFQITGTALYLKAGTTLDHTAKPSYSVTVNVDDTTVGSTPDASTSLTLAITASTGGTASLIISEVAPWSSGNSSILADWFEVTNIGTATASISGWKVDDNSNSFGSAVALLGVTSIAPGESVIFIETSGTQTAAGNATAFKNVWFGGNAPANLQIGSYGGSGIGLGTTGDALNLYDSGGTLQANVVFGTATTTSPLKTFDNAAGLNNTTITALSATGVNGAFSITDGANGTAVGSPGTIGASTTPVITLTAQDASAAEAGADPGTFRITRTGATTNSLTVNYTISGTGSAADYTPVLSGTATIASGQSFVDITITPVDDSLIEGPETVVLTLFDSGSYDVGSPASATVTITDNDFNLAPTAVSLTNMVASLADNTSTAGAVRVADITVTDDGQGTSTLSVSGADAASFQITGTSLYLKAGTTLNASTKSSYSVTVNVDDTTVGGTPDASTNFTLTVTASVPAGAIIVSEVAPWSSSTTLGADWFELTNISASTVTVSGWKMDDNSNASASAVPMSGVTSIAPGESVIFIETSGTQTAGGNAATFKTLWWGSNPPANLQIGSYAGSGVGLGTSGDAVNIFDSSGNRITGVSFGAITGTASLDNKAGAGSTTLPLPAISTLSSVVANGAFAAANDSAEIGSPGNIGVGKLIISEVAPWSSSTALGADWFEVTNIGYGSVDVTGWKMDDNSNAFASAAPMSGVTSIAPGESVIFIETSGTQTAAGNAAAFKALWFGANPPAALQVGAYSGSGVGLGTSGDAVNLFDSAGNRVTGVSFGSISGTASLDNKAGAGSTTLPLPAISTLSSVGTNGAFAAAGDSAEIGSPGTTVTPPTTAPSITTQPASQSVPVGATATLTVAASGTPAPTFQWYQGASGTTTSPVAGATSASFTTPALTSNTGYWARATNSAGTADSQTAVLTVGYTAPYTSGNRNVLTPNTGAYDPAGVTIGGTQFVNLGLQGVGRVAASTKDPATGESLGSISDLQITGWTKNGDGSYSGVLNTLPDRGYNNTNVTPNVFSNYAARINAFSFSFTPYIGSSPTTGEQIAMTFTGSTRFTYDNDGDSNTPPVYTTGLNADGKITLFGTDIPVAGGGSTQSDGTVVNRLTLDSEGLVLDKRTGKEGSGWIGDEYGGYIYHFNAGKKIDGIVKVPAAIIPHKPAGTVNFNGTPDDGRRDNQGMEGLTQSPDGTRLFGLLQSATIQDSGSGNIGRSNARLLVYDISSTDTPAAPVAQYVMQLPLLDDTGSTTNGATVTRNGAQSSILAINNHQILVLSRDGNGRGATGSPVFKSILLADINGATNFGGTYDAEGTGPAPGGVLDGSITPMPWTEALNMIGKLGTNSLTEVEKFGLNLNAAPGDIHSICEKWESMGLVPCNDPANPNDFFLFLGNDNDFLTSSGKCLDASGTLQSYDGGLENDTVVLAFRVRIAAPDVSVATDGIAITDGQSTAIDFGSTDTAHGAAKTFTITSGGVSSLTGVSVTVDGADASSFQVSSAPATTIAAGASADFVVTFAPTTAGSKSATIHVLSNAPGTLASYDINVSGTATPYTSSSFSLSAATNTVSEDAGPLVLTLNRTGDTTIASSVTLSTTDGTATAGVDYTALNQVVPFGIGDTSKTVSVAITNRFGAAASRAFTATLSSPTMQGVLGSPASTTVTITPVTSPGTVSFSASSYSVSQGATSITLTVGRSGGAAPFDVTIHTADGTASIGSPPFSAAVAPTDYTALTGAATTVHFSQGDASEKVTITLKPAAARATLNRRFTATLSAPTNGATLGATTTTTAQIFAADVAAPTVAVTAPLANQSFIITGSTVNLAGLATDAHGVAGVTYSLNGGPYLPATLGVSTNNGLTTAFSATLAPLVEGANTVVVKAADVRGNTAAAGISRSFTYHLSSTLTLNRVVPAANSAAPDDVGNVVAVNAIFPTTANLITKTANVQLGKTVSLIPTTKVGYMFKSWTFSPAVTTIAGAANKVTFDMVSGLTVTAEWVKNPYVPGAGTYVGLVKAQSGTDASNGTEGYTRIVVTSAATFSGQLYLDGLLHVFTGSFDAMGASVFGTARITTLSIDRSASGKPSLVVDLSFNAMAGNNKITGTVTADTAVSDLVADKAVYSVTSTVPSPYLNVSAAAPRGYYTVIYPSKAQNPAKPLSSYPQGDGYATITLLNSGVVTVTSYLADGTIAVASSLLVEGNKAPIFTQIITPGAAATVKGGSFGGNLTFDLVPNDSDVLGADLEWFRPATLVNTTNATTLAATNLYTDGWPDGVKVDALGARYNAATHVAASLGLGVVDSVNGNGKLVLSDGKLTSAITKTKFNIAPGTVANTSLVTRIPATDSSYTLAPAQATGLFTGTFTPNWSNPATAKPVFKGVLLQKGASKGGYGFFLSNASGDADPESGGVSISSQH